MSAESVPAVRTPVTAGMIRRAGKPPMPASAELDGLLAAVAEALADVLKQFTSSPIRVEPDGLAPVSRETPVPDGVVAKLTSAKGALSPVLLADRTLVMALCEAAFGGSGTEPAHDGADRPLSRAETKLRDAFLSALAGKFPETLALCFGTAFSAAEEEVRKPARREVQTISYIGGRLLVYIFGYSGEVALLLPEDEIAHLASSGRRMASDGGATRDAFMQALAGSELEIIAMLPEEQMPMGQIARLRHGQLLKLNADVGTTVVLMAEGQPLHTAHMASGGDAMRFEIINS